jgi:hypothetical protein
MKAIITGSIRAAKEDLLHIGRPDVAWWRDARLHGVVNGVEVFIVPVGEPDRMRGIELSDYDIHPTAHGSRHLPRALEIARSCRRVKQKEQSE